MLSALAWSATAGANGRPAATSTINFEQGHPDHIAAGMTFGMLWSTDGGATWTWMCEVAVGYGGMYDPVYAYSSSGAIFATTFDGLKVMRDGCTFESTPPGMTFVSEDRLGPTGMYYYAAADQNDAKIYRSSDDGVTFPVSASPGMNNDWWDSLLIAPSDPTRVYLSGYRFVKVCNAFSTNAGTTCTADANCTGPGTGSNMLPGCESQKVFLLFRSTDGGASFTPVSTTGINTSVNSAIDFVGVDATRPDVVYIHVNLDNSNGNLGDSIYKSTNGGGTVGDATAWKKLLATSDPFGLSFVLRSNGDLIAATQTSGTMRSTAGDACTSMATCNWQMLTSPPHINCLAENPATLATTHEVWACTHNYDSPDIPGDGYGIMKTTDFVTWNPVLKYQDIKDPVTCAPGTAQHDQCVESYMGQPSVWCCLEQQLGITAMTLDNGQPLCVGANACGGVAPDAGNSEIATTKPGGCCGTGGGGAGALLVGLGTGALLIRSRRVQRRKIV